MSKTDFEKTVGSWLGQAQEDLKTAKALLEAARYTWCAFICQQAIEKCLKAGYVKLHKKIPPYTHKLELLCQLLKLKPPQNILDLIIRVDKYYIATRYPAYKESVNIRKKTIANNIYKQTEEAFGWLIQALGLRK